MAVHLAVGMRGPPTPIVMVTEMFLTLRSDCPKLRSQKGDRSHSDGIKHTRVEPSAPSAPTNQARG